MTSNRFTLYRTVVAVSLGTFLLFAALFARVPAAGAWPAPSGFDQGVALVASPAPPQPLDLPIPATDLARLEPSDAAIAETPSIDPAPDSATLNTGEQPAGASGQIVVPEPSNVASADELQPQLVPIHDITIP